MRRRAFLGGIAAAAVLPRSGRALGTPFRYGELAVGTATSARAGALRRLAWELDKRTAVQVALDPIAHTSLGATLFETPFVWLAGDRAFDLPAPTMIDSLRRYLTFGGLLFLDSAEGALDGGFDRSCERLVGALWPRDAATLQPIASTHVLYQSFYVLDAPHGRLALSRAARGVVLDGRLAIVHSANDTAGAYLRDAVGNYALPCEPGGERQREMAYRFGINLTMYALCLDYKTDQVHMPTLRARRRWRSSEPTTP